MATENKDLYSRAHLFVAAVRVCEHNRSAPPSIEDVCRALSFTMEQGGLICRKLENMGILEVVEGSFGTRLFVKDHLKIEEIPRGVGESKLDEELKKFQNSQKAITQKVETLRSEQAAKKKDLFAAMEKKLREELEKKTKPPNQ
jgi:hypothetical protein